MQEKATDDERLGAILDASHATPEVVKIVTSTLADKSSRDVDRTMTHFSQELLTYTDATLGSTFRDWSAQKGIFEQFMAMWGEGTRCYPTRIVGDARSAMVVFVDSPEMFGHEVRIMAPMDFRYGKIIRQVDYWDGRQFGIAALEQHRFPADRFPTDFGEPPVGERANPTLQHTASALSEAFANSDSAAAAELFATDAVFEDLTLRTAIVGAPAIGVYLERSLDSLPYGPGTRMRHAVGSERGGGYEWTGGGAVGNGVVALELGPGGRITRLTALWDASRVDTATVTALLGQGIER